MFDNADLNIDAYGIECKMNNNYTHVARWSVSNTLLVNSFHHYLCTYGTSCNSRRRCSMIGVHTYVSVRLRPDLSTVVIPQSPTTATTALSPSVWPGFRHTLAYCQMSPKRAA
jgi:hypothetical protein